MYSQGISKEGDVLDQATNHQIIQKTGTWFSYNETRLGQGRENVKRFLHENQDIYLEIEKKVRTKLGLIPAEEIKKTQGKQEPDK